MRFEFRYFMSVYTSFSLKAVARLLEKYKLHLVYMQVAVNQRETGYISVV
jgi:hypothetical protein